MARPHIHINKAELQAMLDGGMSRRQAADHYRVSPSKIDTVLKPERSLGDVPATATPPAATPVYLPSRVSSPGIDAETALHYERHNAAALQKKYDKLKDDHKKVQEKLQELKDQMIERKIQEAQTPPKESPLNGLLEGVGEGFKNDPVATIEALKGLVQLFKAPNGAPGQLPPANAQAHSSMPAELQPYYQALINALTDMAGTDPQRALDFIGAAFQLTKPEYKNLIHQLNNPQSQPHGNTN